MWAQLAKRSPKRSCSSPNNLPILLSNRSVCRLLQKKYMAALHDANEIISISPNSMRGYYRRGMAELELGQLHDARISFAKAAKLQPRNAELKQRAEQVRSALARNGQLRVGDLERKPSATPAVGKGLEKHGPRVESTSTDHQIPAGIKHWMKSFFSLSVRAKEYILGCLWNESTKQERHLVCCRYLELAGCEFKGRAQLETSLVPMHNYSDLEAIPPEHLECFKSLSIKDKLFIYEAMYNHLPPENQKILIDFHLQQQQTRRSKK